jgi:hypothetical protein
VSLTVDQWGLANLGGTHDAASGTSRIVAKPKQCDSSRNIAIYTHNSARLSFALFSLSLPLRISPAEIVPESERHKRTCIATYVCTEPVAYVRTHRATYLSSGNV